MTGDLALVKLGGSVVTFKQQRLLANVEAINNISKILAGVKMPIVIVHGGGSFGHYWSVRYGMHTKPDHYDSQGISVVHESMIALNEIIVNSLIRNNLNPYSVMPTSFMLGQRPVATKVKEMLTIAQRKIIPVTFGDIIHTSGGRFSIISGDALMAILAEYLKPSKVIFTLNVDGLYKDIRRRQIIREIDPNYKSVKFADICSDVTGGMKRKIREAFKIATLGIDVFLINGFKTHRILDVLAGKDFEGTMVKSRIRQRSKRSYA